MRKKENSEHKTFNLDGDVITLIREGSNINGMTQSEFVEFLVNSWDENINPLKNLKHLRSKKKLLGQDIVDIEKQENVIMDNMQKVETWRSMKQEAKPQIIQNLVRIISRGDKFQAEVIAKNQSVRLGIPATQLLLEAVEQINKRNLQLK